MHPQKVIFKLWESGAYTICSHNDAAGTAAFVQHDGRHAVRVVGLTKAGFEETRDPPRRRSRRHAMSTSTLRGDRKHKLELHWTVTRPGFARTEVWKVSPHTKGTWKQVDVRPGRTTTYHVVGPWRYEGKTVNSAGEPLWTSHWQSDGKGGRRANITAPRVRLSAMCASAPTSVGGDSRIVGTAPDRKARLLRRRMAVARSWRSLKGRTSTRATRGPSPTAM